MIEFPLKLAVASKEGMAISEHFGHAKKFLIYQASLDHCQFIETREVAHYCLGQSSDASAMTGILEAIEVSLLDYVSRVAAGEDVT